MIFWLSSFWPCLSQAAYIVGNVTPSNKRKIHKDNISMRRPGAIVEFRVKFQWDPKKIHKRFLSEYESESSGQTMVGEGRKRRVTVARVHVSPSLFDGH